MHRRFFDPHFWRVVIFDQRGAGRSRPLGSLAPTPRPTWSTTSRRCAAISSIERWLLFGGSWGSTLALAYAQAHPDRVRGLRAARRVPRPPGRGRLVPARPRRHLPRRPCRLRRPPARAERGDLLGTYLRRLTDPDPMVHMAAARAWSVYEGSCSTLLPSPDTVASFAQDRTALGLARIEAHYFAHDLFLPPEGLLGHMHRDRAPAGRDRAGPLRHDLPGPYRLRPRRRLAAAPA